MSAVEIYEKMGAFYLGKKYDQEQGQRTAEFLLYDSRDLMTHALCVGMTGSGKTGLCIGLLEEAAMDDIPALIIDPKGDIANLCLLFSNLSAEEFAPWVLPEAARAKGQDVQTYAAAEAEKWRKGLADWDQDESRIRRLKEKIQITVYTPGSEAGVPLSLNHLFTKPSAVVMQDTESLNELVDTAAAGLLSLIGLDDEAARSREQTLLANILLQSWQSGEQIDLGTIIHKIQKPPFRQIGVMDLESFFPQKDRDNLALKFNSLIASPGFSQWLKGDPLNIQNLLYTEEGKPKVSIISTSHLPETERMFFTSIVLNQLTAWVRSQPGTTSLRALFYMDEIFGYFPPVANPPTKKPLLTLLKQARAYGLGIVLTTQNPMDLDYKGLANIGTWFIGRLQTDRDKQRLLDGLEGAALTAGQNFQRQYYDKLISGLGKRIFLLNNVHESEPVLFETRWCMSYLRGPLTRQEIMSLPAEFKQGDRRYETAVRAQLNTVSDINKPVETDTFKAAVQSDPTVESVANRQSFTDEALPSVIPQNIRQFMLYGTSGQVKPYVLAETEIFYENKKHKLRQLEQAFQYFPLSETGPVWDDGEIVEERDIVALDSKNLEFMEVPQIASDKKVYTVWQKELVNHLYHTAVLISDENPYFKLIRLPEETEGEFRIRVQQQARELRDEELDKLKNSYTLKIERMQEKIRKAELALEREKQQAKDAKLQTGISVGATILSSILGKNVFSSGTIGKATTAARSAGRAGKQSGDVARSAANVETYRNQLSELEDKLKQDIEELNNKYEERIATTEHTEIRPLKRDVQVKLLAILWC